MTHRVRAAGVLVEGGRVLLVREGELPSGEPFFVPPGGGLETSDRSLVECLQREFWEEVGLRVGVDDLVYVKEYLSTTTQTHHVEFFFRVHRRVDADETNAAVDRPSRWFTFDELQGVTVFPPELKDGTWLTPGPPRKIYLGRTEGVS